MDRNVLLQICNQKVSSSDLDWFNVYFEVYRDIPCYLQAK